MGRNFGLSRKKTRDHNIRQLFSLLFIIDLSKSMSRQGSQPRLIVFTFYQMCLGLKSKFKGEQCLIGYKLVCTSQHLFVSVCHLPSKNFFKKQILLLDPIHIEMLLLNNWLIFNWLNWLPLTCHYSYIWYMFIVCNI